MLRDGCKEGDPNFVALDEEDCFKILWLSNSVRVEISGTCVSLPTISVVWGAIKHTYLKSRDEFQIRVGALLATQSGSSTTPYFNELKATGINWITIGRW